MDDHRETMCPLCNKTVAPYARHNDQSDRILLGKEVAHRHCFDALSHWAQARLLQTTGADPRTGLR
jgi:hypothetical protein